MSEEKCHECPFFKYEDSYGCGICDLSEKTTHLESLCSATNDNITIRGVERALHYGQKWRRGCNIKQINPRILGIAIDESIRVIRKLRRGDEGVYERWKTIIVDNRYQVSNLGRIRRRYKRGKYKILAGTRNGRYLSLSYKGEDGVCRKELIHRLVAKAFIPNPDRCICVGHIDGNTLNNKITNLKWIKTKDLKNSKLKKKNS